MNPSETFKRVINGDDRLVDPHAQEWEKIYSLFMHLSLLVHGAFPIVIPAVVMWLIKRDKSPFVDDHGREAINFQISLIIYNLAAGVFGFVTCGIGWFMFAPIYILGLVGITLASIAAGKGQFYRYPMNIRFL